MTSAVTSVLIASASSVAKVFLIAIVGFFAVKYPRGNPLIPPHSVGMLSRFAFTILNLPLIYSAIGSTLTIDVLGSLWFLPFSGIVVISLSFLIATITERLSFFRVQHRVDFDALRIACSFPNVVAIPVLVFPSLCEFEVVYSTFITDNMTRNPSDECSNTLNAMTFAYFFAWIFMFFLMGNQILVNAGKRKDLEGTNHANSDSDIENTEARGSTSDEGDDEQEHSISAEETTTAEAKDAIPLADAADTTKNAISSFLVAVKRSILNPGSIAMWLGLVTALIAPLQSALFAPGGALRFVGSAIESLAQALPSIATMITAASLVIPSDSSSSNCPTAGGTEPRNESESSDNRRKCMSFWPLSCLKQDNANAIYDPNYADMNAGVVEAEREPSSSRRSSLTRMRRASARFGSEVRRQSIRAIRSPSVRMHIWFDLTRLVITPAIVCGILIGLDCGASIFDTIPHMAKLVVLLNSSLPSALLVILSLKSEGLSESAAVVAKVYFPSYILSILTITGWASVGLILSIPDDDGKYFCER